MNAWIAAAATVAFHGLAWHVYGWHAAAITLAASLFSVMWLVLKEHDL